MRHNPRLARAQTKPLRRLTGRDLRKDCRRARELTDPAPSHRTTAPPDEHDRHPAEGNPPMATDYDAPRKTDDDLSEDSIEELKGRRVDKSSSSVDVDETEQAEGYELPGADLSNEELSVRVLPRQYDEFT